MALHPVAEIWLITDALEKFKIADPHVTTPSCAQPPWCWRLCSCCLESLGSRQFVFRLAWVGTKLPNLNPKP